MNEMKKTDKEWIDALFTEDMTDSQKYDKLCRLYFMVNNSGYCDSMASDLSSGNPSSQALWWEEVYDHRYAIERECERVKSRLEKYDGETDEDGLPHGKGIKYYLEGGRYEGEWSHGKRDGFGIEYVSDGTKRYEGTWKNDNRYGYGILIDYYNVRYEGFFEDRPTHDQYSLSREKKMVITCPTGEVMEGPLDNGRYRFTYPDRDDVLECEGFSYPTDMSRHRVLASGKGIYRFADGGILVGEWSFGKPNNDDCEYTSPDGKKEIWRHKFGELKERIPCDE